MLCPCCSTKKYDQCCQPIISGGQAASTPEQLMRSRYSAYTTENADYIFATYAQRVRSQQSLTDIKQWAKNVSFINLQIINAPQLSQDDVNGTVEFIASYIEGSHLCQLHEISRFILEDNQWFYLDGQLKPTITKAIGRNELCPCGSTKKFKRCHGAK